MAFTKITNTELNSRGATTLPNQPTISAAALKQEFDAPAKEIVAPHFNNLIDELEADTAGASIGLQAPSRRTGSTVKAVVDAISQDLVTVEGKLNGVTNAGLLDAINLKHEHENKSLLDTYDQTNEDIEDAVNRKHSHSNKSVLDKWSESAGGAPLYNGQPMLGDMYSSEYDPDSTVKNAGGIKSYVTTGLGTKVDKVDGKGLSTNDFTDTLKTKLDGIATGAEVNVQSDWNEADSSSDAFILNKPTLGTSAYKNSTSVVTQSTDLVESGAVKGLVGWGNKNHNKGDASKTFVKSSARTYSFPVSIPIVSGKKYKFVADVSNISGYTGTDALGLRIAKTGGDISTTYAIQTIAQGQIVIEMTATGDGDLTNIYCFIPGTEPGNATITLSNVMVIDGDVTDYSYEPYHASVDESKVDNSVIGTVEGANASQAYAVGQHFIRDGAFCTCKQAIPQGGSFTLNTNYTAGDVASELEVQTGTATTSNTDVTIDSSIKTVLKQGHIVSVEVKFTLSANISSSSVVMAMPYIPKQRTHLSLANTDYSINRCVEVTTSGNVVTNNLESGTYTLYGTYFC